MNDRDRLAADLHDVLKASGMGDYNVVTDMLAVRLIALGWTRSDPVTNDDMATAYMVGYEKGKDAALDEERLARALGVAGDAEGMHYWCKDVDGCGLYSDGREFAAVLARAYREDAG